MRLKKVTTGVFIALFALASFNSLAYSMVDAIAAPADDQRTTTHPSQSPAPAKSFAPDKMETILYGVAYYPEYMPSERLDTDVELMRKAGINVVRVGESTWSSWEPRDGDFQFAWMQRVLDRLHQAGIKVILGTPTYSIPTWLYKEHPEIAVTHATTAAPRLSNPYYPTYPGSGPPGAYGPRQNSPDCQPFQRSPRGRRLPNR
jgi:beta-galactosidase